VSSSPSKTTLSVPDLRQEFKGAVIPPDDPSYDQARQEFYGGFEDLRPAMIIRPVDVAEVAQVVRLARDSGLELAVRGGGHSTAGHSTSDGGLVLDLSAMKQLDIDPEARAAWAEAGLTAGEVTTAVGEHGLAVGFGDTASVGIGGITLGGGVGFLARKHGLTVDNLLAVELVTADGDILQVDDRQHPELFWALRGGGGNFGVATRFHYGLHEVGTVTGGMLLLPADARVIAGFMAAAEAAPEELSGIANVMVAPPMPMIPAEAHGQLVMMALMVYAGPAERAEGVLAPFRGLATPLADLLQPMPYHAMFQAEEEPFEVVEESARSLFVDAVDTEVAEAIIEHLRASTATMAVAQLRALGGAIARVPADATAYAHRHRRIMAALGAVYERAEDVPVHDAWADRFAAALRSAEPGVYVNFLGDEGAARVREAYPGSTWDRLVAVKRRYDPTNLFRRNQNIPPDA
jgi:FAD/FMN-containing dehydrogenase